MNKPAASPRHFAAATLLLAIGLLSANCFGQLKRTTIPNAYLAQPTKRVIRRLLVQPYVARLEHVEPTDSSVTMLDSCGSNGIYRFGRVEQPARRSNYVIVVRNGNALITPSNIRSRGQHKRLLKIFLNSVKNQSCIDSADIERIRNRLGKTLYYNKRKVYPMVF